MDAVWTPEKLAQLREELLCDLPGRFDLSHLAPGYLAPYFAVLARFPVELEPLRVELARRLLQLTIEQAIDDVPFYAEHLAGRRSAELRTLPLLDRAMVEQAGRRIQSRAATYAFTSYTSGTTSGRPLTIDRCEQEQGYLQLFFSKMAELGPEQTARPSLSLVLTGTFHGRVLQLPTRSYGFPVSFHSATRLRQAISLLEREFTVDGETRRIDAIVGNAGNILKLTTYLMERGRDDLAEHVGFIQTSAEYVTPKTRTTLERFWGATVMDLFSLTEMFVRAIECQQTGWYYFEPYAVAEVVGLDDSEPIVEGRGRLALTGLFPFNQMTPFIRYLSGDLVEVRRVESPRGVWGYRFLGRVGSALIPPAEERRVPDQFIAGGEVFDILDQFPDVRRPIRETQRWLPADSRAVGNLPVFQWVSEPPGHALHVELEYPPRVYSERSTAVARAIEQRLGELPGARGLSLRVVPRGPGSLETSGEFRP